MRQAVIPSLFFAAAVTFYLLNSGAPLRVHATRMFCLALGYWIPSIVAGDLSAIRRRWLLILGFVVLSMFSWDVLAGYVIGNFDPLQILKTHPWVYLVGAITLGGMVVGTAALNNWALSRLGGMPGREHD